MEWFFIIPLVAWVWVQNRRIGALTRQVEEFERSLVALRAIATANAARPAAPAPAAPKPEAYVAEPPAAASAAADEPLILDTPVPEPSNDMNGAAAPTPLEEPLLLTQVVPPDQDPPIPFPPSAATPPPRARARSRRFEQWLAENGLAWLGGGLAAIGGISLVSLAAQQDWFTPHVQLMCAVALGLALLGASEWTRRLSRTRASGHPLVAAMLAGAGVVTFYATAWAAHGLYGIVGWGAAAALLTLCAAILMGLSLLHGQALGVLAIAIALLAPALANAPLWPPAALTLYVCAVGAAGFVVGAFRRWAWVAAATLLGLYFWFAAAIAMDEVRRALALASFAALGGVSIAFRQPLADEAKGRLTWAGAHAYLPAIAISISSVLLLWTWIAISPVAIAGPAWVAAMFVALAAAAVRARAAPPATLVVAVAALVLGFAIHQSARFTWPATGDDFYAFTLFASLVVIASALAAKPHHRSRPLLAAAGAVGAALLTTLAAFSSDTWHSFTAWLPLFSGAAALFAAAWFGARDAQDARTDRAVAFWTAAAAALALLGVESAFPAAGRTAAHAAVSAALALGFLWRGWTMLRHAALTAAAIAVAHALSPDLIGAALAGDLHVALALTILALAAALAFTASHIVARAEPRSWASETLGGAGVLILLVAAFLALRWIAAGGAGAPLDAFTETSLRALALIAAGHVAMPRAGQQTGVIGAWRGHALMCLGLLYALFIPAIALNPWWGAYPAQIAGPFLVDTLTVAFAAPAALALTAARRLYDRQRTMARIYAASGGLLSLLWAVLELRRAFHGGDTMAYAPVGLFEAACYALTFLAGALAIAVAARIRAARDSAGPFTHDLVLVSRGCAWAGIALASLILLTARHPWWGGHAGAETNDLATLLAVLAQAAAAVLALALGRALSRSPQLEPTRFAAASAAAVYGWSFGHALIRWIAQRGEMDDGAPLVGLEGFAHALWPLAFVLAGAALTARAPHRDTIRPYLYDLQSIWAAAIWPTLAFAALGLWLLFNPWWGLHPAPAASLFAALPLFAAYALAAWMSARATHVPHLRRPDRFAQAATIAAIGHLLVAATLIVRRLYHPGDMGAAPVTGAEVWVYSAVWALFGAGVFWLGMRRSDALQRWIGLAILVGDTVYVFVLAFTRLTGLIQIGSMIGLAIVLLVVAWFARANRLGVK